LPTNKPLIKDKSMKNMKKTFTSLFLIFMISCRPENHEKQNRLVLTTPSSMAGNYQVILRPVNNDLSGWIPNGKSDIRIDEERMELITWVDDSSSVTHRQYILSGNRCPDARDDSNQDGVIDIMETLEVAGKILIPLDDELGTQLTPDERFPVGNFLYQKGINLNVMEEDLRAPDSETRDQIIKLAQGEKFYLENKVMIILGVSEKKILPVSVRTLVGVSPQLSTPIVCGIIHRLHMPY
jgi:hypothetical protein